ncbi:DUF4342 domain-containing protein [Caldanaerobius polysaccharolyticus]|uniref:DUF4342 domain-containing protein n=1 Tax=Caldanaerobius polysaccharolyticus TaxID=44256 RepID=UPI0004791FCF|nr:DUF4342 domain-containing protein [Caldanaerobius polysaccharolyticus]
MDVRLEDIDIIRERTGVSYSKAKEALEKTGGNVVDAIIYLENEGKSTWSENISVKGSELLKKLEDIIKKGNVTKIRVKKGDKVIVDIPVTVGVITTVFFPYLALLGSVIALAAEYTLQIERPSGEITSIMVSEKDNKGKM